MAGPARGRRRGPPPFHGPPVNRGRPRTAIGTYGAVYVTDIGGRYRALARFRDLDGRLRRVTATARSRRTAEALLKERLLDRAGYGSGGIISRSSPFGDLAWRCHIGGMIAGGSP